MHQAAMNGSAFARRSGGNTSNSASSRAWKKSSSPTKISEVRNGATGSMTAPASAKAVAAASMAARTAGCGLRPAPMSSTRPSLRSFRLRWVSRASPLGQSIA
jgi:hypothetical protein